MPVLVTGASGLVGRALIPRLVDTGGQVRVYVRRDVPEYRALGVKVAIGEPDHEGRLESALEQVHTIVHLVGGPVPDKGVSIEWLNLETTEVALRAATNAEVQRFLFVSHIGADPSSDHPYLAAKGRAEEAIRSAGLEYALLRCAPILAPGSALMTFLERGGSGDARLNPSGLEECAAALVAADSRDATVRGEWELGGPEIVTLDELSRRFGSASTLRRMTSRPPATLVSLYEHDFIAARSQSIP